MAIQRKQNFLGGMRIDTPYLRAVEEGVAADFDNLINGVLGDGTSNYIIRGIEPHGEGGSATSFYITLSNAVIATKSDQASLFKFSSEAPNFFPFTSLPQDNVYFICINLVAENGVPKPAKFIDSITKIEFDKQVPLEKNLSYYTLEPSFSPIDGSFVLCRVSVVGGIVSFVDLQNTGTSRAFGDSAASLFEWISQTDATISNDIVHGVTAVSPLVVSVSTTNPEISIDKTGLSGKETLQYDSVSSSWQIQKLDIGGIAGTGNIDDVLTFNGTNWVASPPPALGNAGGILGYPSSAYPNPNGLATDSNDRIPMTSLLSNTVTLASVSSSNPLLPFNLDINSKDMTLNAEKIVFGGLEVSTVQNVLITDFVNPTTIQPTHSFIYVSHAIASPILDAELTLPDPTAYPNLYPVGTKITIMDIDTVKCVHFSNYLPGNPVRLGAATRTLYKYDSITFICTGVEWVEISFTDIV
jgi:hypothetical protein